MSLTSLALAAALTAPAPDGAAVAPAAAEPAPAVAAPAVAPAVQPVPAPETQPPTPPVSTEEAKPAVYVDDQGGIVVVGRGKPPKNDPLQNINVETFEVVQSVDRAVIGPVAHAYQRNLPGPLQRGVHNVLTELEEPTVFINFVLQHKIGKAAETLARFAVNATVGLGGLIDVAKSKPINLPHRRNGFGYTLGFYGVGPGPYLFLPLIGSTTLRDFGGRMLDLAVLPTAVGKPFKGIIWTVSYGTMREIDDRVERDDILTQLRDNDPDPYVSMKKYYLQLRQAEIDALRGKPAKKPQPADPAKP
mgnify:CR=1 FL=1